MRIIEELILVGAATVRTNCYLQYLVKAKIKPKTILLLSQGVKGPLLQGQLKQQQIDELNSNHDLSEYFDLNISINELISNFDLNVIYCFANTINDKKVIKCIKNINAKFAIFSGAGGDILRDEVLNLPTKFIHVHPGEIPKYKGSTTIYYSILNENSCHASAFFLEKEIDSGDLLLLKKFHPPKEKKIIDYVFDPHIRGVVLIELITEYIKKGKFISHNPTQKEEETYFIIHPLLKHIAILK